MNVLLATFHCLSNVKKMYIFAVHKYILQIQGIPAFRDFTIRDPRYFVILFQ